jgi:hypothetical protein
MTLFIDLGCLYCKQTQSIQCFQKHAKLIENRFGRSKVQLTRVWELLTRCWNTWRWESRCVFTAGGERVKSCFVCRGMFEYELILKTDLYTQRHTQWYFFRVHNAVPGVTYKFKIVNLLKSDSLYNYGKHQAPPPPPHHYTHARAYALTHARIYTRVHRHARTHKHAHTDMHARINTHTGTPHTYIHAHTHTHTHTHTHAHTHTGTRTHTHTQTHTHTLNATLSGISFAFKHYA